MQEEQLLELVMNGMRVSGLALAVEALSSLILGMNASMPSRICRNLEGIVMNI